MITQQVHGLEASHWYGVPEQDIECRHWLAYLPPSELSPANRFKLTLDFKSGELIDPDSEPAPVRSTLPWALPLDTLRCRRCESVFAFAVEQTPPSCPKCQRRSLMREPA